MLYPSDHIEILVATISCRDKEDHVARGRWNARGAYFSALRQFIYTASLVCESGGVTGAGTIAYYRCARSVKLLLLIN